MSEISNSKKHFFKYLQLRYISKYYNIFVANSNESTQDKLNAGYGYTRRY